MNKKKNQPLLLSLALVFLSLFLNGCQREEVPSAALLEIPFVTVVARDISIPLDVVGETVGSTDVTIRARVDGFLEGIHFQEGTFVDKGKRLYSIDPQPFQAKLAQAKAALAQARTGLAKTQSDLNRIRPLAEIHAVSEQDLDSAVANYEAAQSYVEAAKAQVELAEIELDYTKIHSPVSGLIGLSEAEVGDFVSQRNNGGLLNVISRTDPIAVRVSITERDYLTAARQLAEQHQGTRPGSGGIDRPNSRPLTLILADGSTYPHRGFPTKIDRNIDPMTGSLTIEAEFPNAEALLRPGMFARIRFDSSNIPDAILLPQRAVSELQSAYRVFVIRPDDTIEVRQVQVGQRLGSDWVIESGLRAGERVAVAGLLRLRADMKVKPQPAAASDLPPSAAKDTDNG